MAESNEGQGTGQETSKSGSDTQPNPTGDKAAASGQPSSGSGKAEAGGKDAQFVTPAILSGVLNAHTSKQAQELAKLQQSFNDRLGNLTKTLEDISTRMATTATPKSKADSVEDPALIDLKRQNRELLESVSKLQRDREDALARERDFRFETQVKDALAKAKCTKIEAVYRMIKPDLQYSEDGKRIFTTVKNEFGTSEELDVSEYIRRVVSEEMVPEMFLGKARASSPAGGDAASDGGKYDFSAEEARNPDFYAKHRDKILAAAAAGRIRPAAAGAAK